MRQLVQGLGGFQEDSPYSLGKVEAMESCGQRHMRTLTQVSLWPLCGREQIDMTQVTTYLSAW